MSNADQTYLLTIARTLRDVVAPHVDSRYAQVCLLACQHMLMRLAHPLAAAARLPPLPVEQLPPELRAQLGLHSPGTLAPKETPAENTAISPDTLALIEAASAWIDSQSIRAERPELTALVDWEGAVQDIVEQLHETLDVPRKRDIEEMAVLDPGAVEQYFRSRFGEQVRLRSFTQLLGGRSKQTALLSFEGLAGWPAELVIRRDQTAQTITGSIVTEFPLLEALFAAGVTVPRPLLLETSTAALGKPFAVVERVGGESLGTHFAVPREPQLAFALAEQLATLHSIPVQKFAAAFPDAALEDAPDRRREQLDEMRSAWLSLSTSSSITMAAAFRWLEANIDCATGPLSLVHGDLGFHNMMIDGPRLVALLDWETAHIDHPAGDLGYVRPVIERMVPWPEFMARYQAAGGRPLTSRQVHFFGIWEVLRINIRLRHCRDLYETGATDDPLLGEVGAYYVPRFLHRISQHLRRALHDLD